MSFKADFDSECARCRSDIKKGDEINYRNGRAFHTQCDGMVDPAEVDSSDTITWSVTQESLDRYGREDAELARVAPLERPTCPGCFLELPVSMVCGSC